MDDAFEDGCGDNRGGDACPICRGEELDPDFLARITAAAAQPSRMMTAEEAIEWIRSL
jgi:hypothetical protein